MMDRGRFRKRFLLGLLTSPVTLWPLLAGVTLFFVAWALSLKAGVTMFVAAACILGALGVFFTRLALGDEKLAGSIVADMRREAHSAREKSLDELDEKLSQDGDPRTEASLRDLRALAKAFNAAPSGRPEVPTDREVKAPSDTAGGGSLGSRYTFDIASGVEDLFDRCVRSLEDTLRLWRTAGMMATDDAKRPVLEQREKIIGDVRESTKRLGEVLAGLQCLRVGEDASSGLARIREELDERLAVAKRVEERMRALEKSIDPGESVSPGQDT